jgi:hypothetical protein
MTIAADTVVLRYDLGWEDVREVMATSRLLILMRRSWLIGGAAFAALMAESIVLLRIVITRPAGYGTHRDPLLTELIVGASLCLLLLCWSALRVWRLSPGPQARHAIATGVWQSGIHEYKIRDVGVAWKAPDGSAVFLPWSVLTGVRETERLFLLLDQASRHVRGFIPKAGLADLPPEVVGRLIRERISAGRLDARFAPAQRVAPQQVAAIADAGQQPGRGDPDLPPAHVRVHDRRSGFALAVQGAVDQVDRYARGSREKVGRGFVRRQADDGEAATGTQHPGHRRQRSGEVHVVKRGVRADEVEAGRLEGVRQEVRFDEPGPAVLQGSGQGDHPRLPVDAGDLSAAFGEAAGEHAVPAADVEGRTAAGRDGRQDDRLVVDVVVPIAGPSHHPSRVRRIPLGLCAR